MAHHAQEIAVLPDRANAAMPDMSLAWVVLEGAIEPQEAATVLLGGRAVVLPAYVEAVGAADPNHKAMFKPEAQVREAVSAHQVTFGVVMAGNTSVPVALKPFNSLPTAINELGGYQKLLALGIPTYHPYAVMPAAEGGRWMVLTALDPSLVSLDQEEWIPGLAVTTEAEIDAADHNRETIKKVATLFAFMHANGIGHPDGQIKNCAVTPDGRIGIIDTENLIQVPLNDYRAAGFAWRDIEKLTRSLVYPNSGDSNEGVYGVGVLAGMSLQLTRELLRELVIEPYLAALGVLIEQATPEQASHILTIHDAIIDRFDDPTASWPQHFLNNRH